MLFCKSAPRLKFAGVAFAPLLLTMLGCSSTSNPPTPTQVSEQGGVSGGGGGTVAATNVSADQIHTAIEQSRLVLALYFNDQQTQRRLAEVSAGPLLFDGAETIFDEIRTATIELNEQGACVDPKGAVRDGAAPGRRPNSICISVKNLESKLTIDNYWDQTIALVGHELSHLVGTNEVQALALQMQIIKTLEQTRPAKISDLSFGGFSKIQSIKSEFYSFTPGITHVTNPSDVDQELLKVMAMLENTLNTNALMTDGLSTFDAEATDLWWAAYWKTQMLSHWACANDHSRENPRDQICESILLRNFSSNKSLTLPEIEKRMNSGAKSQNPAGFLVRTIQTQADFDLEVTDLFALYTRLASKLLALPSKISSFDPGLPASVPTDNAITWKTNRVLLSADDFHITTAGSNFYGPASGADLHSDPGGDDYWSLESEWVENGVPMRLYLYFAADQKNWWVSEIRIYDGSTEGQWVFFKGKTMERPLGSAFTGDLDLAQGASSLHLKNILLKVTLH